MTSAERTLFWTADSPYSRIVLWAVCESDNLNLNLVHLNWAELNDTSWAGKNLGPELTVPCLSDGQSHITCDSLRILATLQKSKFHDWFVSADGALHRFSEGQLGRIMYALYDGVEQAKIHPLWLRAIESACRLIENLNRHDTESSHASTGQIALHTFLSFCVGLRPELQKEIPPQLRKVLVGLEQTPSFAALNARLKTHAHLIRCDAFSRSPADGGASSTDAAR